MYTVVEQCYGNMPVLEIKPQEGDCKNKIVLCNMLLPLKQNLEMSSSDEMSSCTDVYKEQVGTASDPSDLSDTDIDSCSDDKGVPIGSQTRSKGAVDHICLNSIRFVREVFDAGSKCLSV